ncbi:Uncharacterised protein [Achromobacter kerstersii]|nr:Uncharacterised protein [Achromobacter kerstersii]
MKKPSLKRLWDMMLFSSGHEIFLSIESQSITSPLSGWSSYGNKVTSARR